MQLLHAASPISDLYLPATHNMHAVPSGPVDPVLHVQSVCSSLAAGAFERTGHSKHEYPVLLPIIGEYSPSAQLLQIALPLEVL